MEFAKVIVETLAMYTDTDVASGRITEIPQNAIIAILEKGKYWCKVVYNEFTGYIPISSIKLESDSNDKVTVTLSQDCANEVYEALKLSLNT